MKKLSKLLFLEMIRDSLLKGDIVARQRFHLFKLATLYTLIIYTSFLVQMSIVEAINYKVLVLITFLFIAIMINYLCFAVHKKQETASILLLGLLYTLLHIVAYLSGGLRNSTMLYIPALILLSYMLLGKKGGMAMAGLTLFHLALFYYLNTNTSLVNYDLLRNDPGTIDLDFFITAVLGILMVTVQASYIEKSKNEIIEDIKNKNFAFKQLNESLEKKIRERTKELVEKKMLLDEAQQLARIGNWNVDLLSGQVIWSDGTRAMLGVGSDFNATFDAFTSLINPENREEFIRKINDPAINHEVIEDEFRISRPGQHPQVIYSQTRCIFDRQGHIIRIYGILQDITERKVAEETLKHSEANLHTIFDNTKTCYILLDTHLNVLSFNPMAKEWAKNALHAELREGSNYIDYYPVERHAALRAKSEKVLQAQVDHYEITYLYPDQTFHHYEVLLSPVLIKKAVSGICIALSDITEKKQSERETQEYVEELQLKNKNLRQFAYMVSHNLRAPIAKIQGLAYLFEEDNNTENNNTLIKFINSEVENLDHVINDMNAIITTGDAENIIREEVEFNTEFKLIAKVLENQIMESNAEISCDFRSVPVITSVKSYIYSMMYNLLSNSIKYRSEERRPVIDVKTTLADNFICLSVEDNGIGINVEKHRDKIFDLYARIHNNTVPGKGMGLSMVKVQAETLGGRVELDSELNKGSTFRIFLPVS
jgi:PAS domain S-box-containing protein